MGPLEVSIMKRKIKFLVGGFAAVSLALASLPASASNGIQTISTGPVSLSMGGAGVARPITSRAVYINPAGMNALNNRVDLDFTAAFPDHVMTSSVNPGAVGISGTDDAAFFPGGSIVFTSTFTDKLALGVGALPNSGFGVEFPVSRFPTALTGNAYDTSARYGNVKIIPAFSFQVLDNLTLGAGLDIGYSFLETDTATLLPGFPETMGRSRFDSALGIGGRVGVIYQPHKMLHIGAMYVFRQRNQAFDRYKDFSVNGIDGPRQIHVGLATMPTKGVTILTDFRWLNWADSGIIGQSIAAGGAAWGDQYTFAGGFEYNFDPVFGFPAAIRAGYNYGNSPITGKSAFRNILIPATIEHHITTGFSLDLGEYIGLDAAYIYEFRNSVTDDGTGSPVGLGSTVGTQASAFAVGVHGQWGKKSD